MASRLNSSQRGYNRAWNKYSKQYRRDNPWCVSCLPRLTPAECVDHIIPISGNDDPLFWDSDNHQSLCWSCHSFKTAVEDGGAWGGGSVAHPDWLPKPACKVTVVCGSPGSGKSTYVDKHIKAGDVLIDLDACLKAVSGMYGSEAPIEYLTPAIRMRNRLLATLATRRKYDAWFIVSAPTKAERDWWADKLHAEIVFLDVPYDVCAKRITKDKPRQGRMKALDAWHELHKANKWTPPKKMVTTGLDGWPVE